MTFVSASSTSGQVSSQFDSRDSQRQWWAQQWLDLINSYRFKKRLERGWKYAREGNVLEINFKEQQVLARVQGTDPKPYRVSLGLTPLTDEDWDYVIEALSQKAIFSAQLLAGEMPSTIESVFATCGLRLFPFQLAEVKSRCSCPDKANPCKHISAVYYLLGDRFREDPFVLFQLRGRTRSQILTALRHKRLHPSSPPAPQESSGAGSPPPEVSRRSPHWNLQTFWQYDQPLESDLVVIVPPPEPNTPLDRLGDFPLPALSAYTHEELNQQRQRLNKTLRQVYQIMAQEALRRSMGNA